MTPAARVQAAIEILQELETTALPADRFIRDWFRPRRYAGSKDRAAVAERVFDVLRQSGFTWTCSDLVSLPDRSSAPDESPFPGRAMAWAQTVHAWPSSEKRA